MSSTLNFLLELARNGINVPSTELLEARGLTEREIVAVHNAMGGINRRIVERARDVLSQIPGIPTGTDRPKSDRAHKDGIRAISITFPVPMFMPSSWDRVLVDLVGMMCDRYEEENPTRTCWPAGIGSLPQWSQADAMFLGATPDKYAPESGEPTFDNTVFSISCSERRASDSDLKKRGIDPSTVKEDWEL